MTRNPGEKALAEKDVRETPLELFGKLNAEFRFTLDAAATHGNALCDRYYTEQGLWHRDDEGALNPPHFETGLTGAWSGECVWCNPPFSELLAWTDKAWGEQLNAEKIVMLVPANRTDREWWQKNVAPYVKAPGFDVRWFAERHRFTVDGGKPILNKQGKVGSPSFACCLLIWS